MIAQLIKNYLPVSLLPICSKIFGKVTFNSLCKYLDDNHLLASNQQGFALVIIAYINYYP